MSGFVVQGSGGSGGAYLSVAAKHQFTGATLAACRVARDAHFASNPLELKAKVVVALIPANAEGSLLEEYSKITDGVWTDITPVLKGGKGEPFIYANFTAAQLLALKGDKGDKLTFADLTSADKDSLKKKGGYRFKCL